MRPPDGALTRYPWTNCSRRPWSGPRCLFRDPTCCFFSRLCCRSWGRSSLYTCRSVNTQKLWLRLLTQRGHTGRTKHQSIVGLSSSEEAAMLHHQ